MTNMNYEMFQHPKLNDYFHAFNSENIQLIYEITKAVRLENYKR